MKLRWLALVGVVGMVSVLGGCKAIGAIAYMLSPRQIQEAEFEFGPHPVAIVIEAAQPGQENPVFTRTLHEELVQLFREKEVTNQVVPVEKTQRLRQANPDYGRWSIQKIGREAGAQQVLYIRLDDLQFRMSPDQPITEPRVRLHVKVIGVTESPRTARQWPPREERQGRLVEHTRQAREVGDSIGMDSEVAKFAREVAYRVAMPFYDVDVEEPIPQEH